MIKKHIILLSLLLSQLVLYSTDCHSYTIGETRKVSYEHSDVIFLGIPVLIEDGRGNFQVVELYKGNENKNVTIEFNKSIDSTDVYCLWLIYGEYSADGVIIVKECSLSRSVNNPFTLSSTSSLPPIMEGEGDVNTDYLFECLYKIDENRWRQEFYEEIEVLRAVSGFEANSSDTVVSDKKEVNYQRWVLLFAIILLLTLAINVYLLFKLRKGLKIG